MTDKTSNASKDVSDVSKAKGTTWVMTIHLSEQYKTLDERVAQISKTPDWVKYLMFGREVGEKCGKEHLQCFCVTWNPVRFSQFKSWIGDSFREPMYGRLIDNERYCSKEGSYTKIGDAPMQGRRTDILGTKRRLDELPNGSNVFDLAEEEPHFSTVMHNYRAMGQYLNNKRMRKAQGDFSKPEVIYIWGPSGSGKDRYIDERHPKCYECLAADGYKWKCGYSMDPVVAYRNLIPYTIKDKAQFLTELDRRLCTVSTKGGQAPWKPKIIYITSVYSPDDTSMIFTEPREFLRRITTTVRLELVTI